MDIGDKIIVTTTRVLDCCDNGYNVTVPNNWGEQVEFYVIGTRVIPHRYGARKGLGAYFPVGYFHLYECKKDIGSSNVRLVPPEDIELINGIERE